jgi:DNA-binding transcriptional MerR regulator/quercetin dioxygenase-like cupin family protein
MLISPTTMPRRPPFMTITQAARILGVSQTSLRNWERLGLLIAPRSQGKYRLYSPNLLQQAKRIRYLRDVKGLNSAGIAHVLKSTDRMKKPASQVPVRGPRLHSQLLQLRHKAKLTLSAVAKKAGISISFLSAIERGEANPSIATLQKLSVIYGTNVRSFFGEKQKPLRLVRPQQRSLLDPQPGLRIERLSAGNTQMDPEIFRVAPGVSSGGSYHHEGEEFIYMLKGKLEIWLDEIERYVLEAGDCLYFESTHAHRWKNLSETETVMLWCNTPPTF